MADVRDILDIDVPIVAEVTKESIIANDKKIRRKNESRVPKRPEGMCREVFALLCKDNNDVPPLFPTDTGKGYKQVKAKLGMKKVRSWKMTAFTNPARSDQAVFHHWRRESDVGKETHYATLNKKIPIPSYTHTEYVQHLVTNGWTRAETDHLFDLCRRFDLRFIVIQDRWDSKKYSARSVEELKHRYYQVCALLSKIRSPNEKTYSFDIEHEQRRKDQLKKLFERTKKQLEEEQMLISELKKIDQRKKERDRKTQDLQKLITAADHQRDPRKNDRKALKKLSNPPKHKVVKADLPNITKLQVAEPTGIKFPDFKNSGVTVRSNRMRLPANLGQKKLKGIEQTLVDLELDLYPPTTEKICQEFNELRSEIVLHYELKAALASCGFELQSLRSQYEVLSGGKTLDIPPTLQMKPDREVQKSDLIDVVGSSNVSNIVY